MRRRPSHLLKLILAGPLILLFALPALAAPRLEQWLSPQLGKLQNDFSYQGHYYAKSDLENQKADMGISGHAFKALTPLWQNPDNELALMAQAGYFNTDTQAILPDSGRKFPDDLWNLSAGFSYRHRSAGGWIWGGFVSLGSPSDKPFHSENETDASLTGFLRLPHGEKNAWLLLLNWTNNRDFLSGSPIPGLAYYYNPSPKFKAILGAPLLALRYRPLKQWAFSLYYMYPRNVDARLTWQPIKRLRLYTGFDWTNQRFYLADRPHTENMLFYFQKRGFLGAGYELGGGLYLNLETGYSFDRLFFEGENYQDRHQERLDLENAWFASLKLGIRF